MTNYKKVTLFDLIKRLSKDQSGYITITIFALFTPIIIGLLAIGIEFNYGYARKGGMQAAADAAAMAGAMQISFENPPSTMLSTTYYSDILIRSQNQIYASLNFAGFTDGITTNRGKINVTPPSIVNTGNAHIITVSFSETTTFAFAKAFSDLFKSNYVSTIISVSAKAEAKKIADYCMIALNPSEPGSFLINGSILIGNKNGCGIAVNSSANCALTSKGTAATINVPVSVVGNNCATGNPPPLSISYGYAVPDPYSANGTKSALEAAANSATSRIDARAISSCKDKICNISLPSANSVINDINDIAGSNTYKFTSPGTYIFECFNAGANDVTSTGPITIIVKGRTGGCGSGGRDINITGTNGLDIIAQSPPSQFAGIALACIANCRSVTVRGGPNLAGSIYAPRANVEMKGNATSSCMQLIADKITLSGDVTLNTECPQINSNASRYVVRLIQ